MCALPHCLPSLISLAEVLPFSDWPLQVEIAVVAAAVYLLTLGLGRLFKARSGLRLGVVYHLFCLAFGPWLALTTLLPDSTARRHLGAACIVFGALALVRPIDRFLWRGYFEARRKVTIPKFVREISAGLLLLLTAFLVVGGIYHFSIAPLIAASGGIGIVLGFAMQDTLGNVIAGLALQFGRPFEIGDWVLIENRHAQVIEINWRSSRFLTNDRVQLDVPNLQVVRASVVNYHGQSGAQHAMRFEVGVDYDVPPNRVKELLARATANAEHVLAEPAPNVFLKSFGDSAVIYEVRYWLNDHRLYNLAQDSAQTHIWYALRRANIRIPFPMRTLHLERVTHPAKGGHVGGAAGRDKRRSAAGELLRAQPIFQGLADEQLRTVVEHAEVHQYGRGEPIIREGTDGASMFVLTRGEAGVTIGAVNNGTPTRVATLRRGDCFGEMSLLTGEPRGASVLAVSDCEVLEITKPVFAEIVTSDPSLLPRLSELLARRQMETEGILQARAADAAVVGEKAEEYRAGFLSKLRSFFEV